MRLASKSSGQWLDRQSRDIYTNLAKSQNYRSRAAYKLLEIDDQYKLFNSRVRNIVDLGFAPGSWTQVAIERSKAHGQEVNILGVDLIPCTPPLGSNFIQGNILSRVTQTAIKSHFSDDDSIRDNRLVDLILSDMMTNTIGIKDADHIASMDLCDGALILAVNLLKSGGCLVLKYYTGREEELLVHKMKMLFKSVYRFKPKSSRQELREMYILGKNKLSKTLMSDIF